MSALFVRVATPRGSRARIQCDTCHLNLSPADGGVCVVAGARLLG